MDWINQDLGYAENFKLFLSKTNQKTVFLRYFREHILTEIKNTESFLDIGAGEGKLTNPIAKYFKNSVALEPNIHLSTYIDTELSSIVSNRFENWQTKQKFDFVLASHAIYYFLYSDPADCINSLLSLLKSESILCLVVQDSSSYFYNINNKYEVLIDKLANEKRLDVLQDAVLPSKVIANSKEFKVIVEFFSEAMGKTEHNLLPTNEDCNQRVLVLKRIPIENTVMGSASLS